MIATMDKWIGEGRFKSRSDLIRTVLGQYEERERTRAFYEMLMERSDEAKNHPEKLIQLE